MRTHRTMRVTVLMVVAVVLAVAGPARAEPGAVPAPGCPGAVSPSYLGGAEDPPFPTTFATGYFSPWEQYDRPDVDGDGVADEEVPSPATSLVIPVTGGTVTFTDGVDTLWVAGIGGPGGLVGATRPGLAVLAYDPATGRSAHAWAFPRGLAPGTYDPRTAGIDLGPGVPYGGPDRDGDGIADLVVVDMTAPDEVDGTTRFLSGAAVAAAAPGTTLGPAATIVSLPGVLIGFGRFDAPSDQLEGVENVYRRDGDPVTLTTVGGRLVLRLLRAGRLTTFVAPADFLDPGTLARGVAFFAWQGTNSISAAYQGLDGVAHRAFWLVDDCRSAASTTTSSGPAPPPTSPDPGTTPPAVAQPGTATFTG